MRTVGWIIVLGIMLLFVGCHGSGPSADASRLNLLGATATFLADEDSHSVVLSGRLLQSGGAPLDYSHVTFSEAGGSSGLTTTTDGGGFWSMDINLPNNERRLSGRVMRAGVPVATFTLIVRMEFTNGQMLVRVITSVLTGDIEADATGFVRSSTQAIVTGPTTVPDDGTDQVLWVRLSAPPDAELNVSVASRDIARLSVNPASLAFTPETYDVPQPITVRGLADSDWTADSVVLRFAATGTVLSEHLLTVAESATAFAPPVTEAVSAADRVALADIDGDGKLDALASSRVSADLSVLRNTSTSGSISFASSVAVSSAVASPADILTADLDGDGRPDLVVLHGTGSVEVFRNTSSPGAISFASPEAYALGGGPRSMLTADLDGDGRLDIVIANRSAGTLQALKNGSSTGSLAFSLETIASTAQPVRVVAADLDADGKLDLAVLSGFLSDPSVSVFLNGSSSGSLSFTSSVEILNQPGFALGSGDLDGDGDRDLVYVSGTGTQLAVLWNDGSADAPALLTSTLSAGMDGFPDDYSRRRLVTADLDGDGAPEIIGAHESASRLVLFRNAGSLGFKGPTGLDTGDPPAGIVVGDLDGDGKVDLLVAQGNTLGAYRNVIVP